MIDAILKADLTAPRRLDRLPLPLRHRTIVDRLTFGGNIIETGTDSYRLATTRARAEQQAVG
ncbi:hypothetical protein SL103_17610 [Streptomyces lydicus]|uniref:Uncharacterized protein n=1 Tax=Streptomyces lydicus TaxID=47763 RepID=A0A1D7VM71_9ACTN|nr:hypothetical protein SL103_17610 [Streptomyces lydicus]